VLDHAREATGLAQGRTRTNLDSDRLLELAPVRLLEVVGEAASRVPNEICARYPQVPWPEIVSMRNRLIHGYDAVDKEILWQVVIQDLPPLIAHLEAILE
jgi:uncharacterized protein with HEPN domain